MFEKPWTYGIYSSTVVRFTASELEIHNVSQNKWNSVRNPRDYEMIVNDCVLIPEREVKLMIRTISN